MEITKTILPGFNAPIIYEPKGKSKQLPLNEILIWLTENTLNIEEELRKKGALLLRGFEAIQTAKEFEAIVSKISPGFMQYEGGTTPRTKVQNNVYTSTELPRFIPIELHQEMSYQSNFPDKIVFFCEVPPFSQGETPIADMREVYQAIPEELKKRWMEKGLRMRRRLPFKESKFALNTWPSVFQTNSREKVEELAEQFGWEIKWKPSYLEVEGELLPVVREHPFTKEKVWFNQAHLLHNSLYFYIAKQYIEPRIWAFAFLKPILGNQFFYHHIHGDKTEISDKDLRIIRQIIRDKSIKFTWQKSDILLLDNILMAHGRSPFKGKRRILASLMKSQ